MSATDGAEEARREHVELDAEYKSLQAKCARVPREPGRRRRGGCAVCTRMQTHTRRYRALIAKERALTEVKGKLELAVQARAQRGAPFAFVILLFCDSVIR